MCPHRSGSVAGSRTTSLTSRAPPAREHNFTLKMFALIAIFSIVAVLNFLRGGQVGASSIAGIKFCSPVFWTFTGLLAPAILVVGGVIGWLFVRKYRSDVESGSVMEGVDLKWTPTQVIVYPLMSLGAGLFASMLGTGVGLLLTPIMLDLNMEPEVVAVTSAFLHLLGAIASLIGYAIANQVLWYMCLVMAAVAAAGQVVGQSVVDFLVRKYQRPSIVALWMALMIGGASVLLIILGGVRISTDVRNHTHLTWNTLCPATK